MGALHTSFTKRDGAHVPLRLLPLPPGLVSRASLELTDGPSHESVQAVRAASALLLTCASHHEPLP